MINILILFCLFVYSIHEGSFVYVRLGLTSHPVKIDELYIDDKTVKMILHERKGDLLSDVSSILLYNCSYVLIIQIPLEAIKTWSQRRTGEETCAADENEVSE